MADMQQSGSGQLPYRLVDLVKPGPSGTVASTAARQSATHAAAMKAAPAIGPGGLLATAAAVESSGQMPGSVMQVTNLIVCLQLSQGLPCRQCLDQNQNAPDTCAHARNH